MLSSSTESTGRASQKLDDTMSSADKPEQTEFRLRGLANLGLQDAVRATLLLLAYIIGSRVITDNSFLTHLATGRLIEETGDVPSIDSYSWTAAGEQWTIQSWLPSVIYHWLETTLGGWAIRFANGLITVSIVANLWRLTEQARQLVVRVTLVGSCLAIGAYIWTPRPLLIGLLALVLVARVMQGWRSPFLLVPILYIWVNSHGSFPLAGVYILLVMAGRWFDTRTLDQRHIRVFWFAVGGAIVSLANPLGWRILWFPIQLLSRSEALSSVAEWASPSFRSPFEWVFLILLGALLIAARKEASWEALLPASVFVITALMAARNLAAASLIITISVAPYLSGLFGSLDGRKPARVGAVGAIVCTVVSGMVTVSLMSSDPVVLEGYPVDAVDWMAERSLVADESVDIAQRDHVGNYLVFRHGSDARVFVDDRFDFYPEDLLEDHRSLIFGGDYAEIVERRNFNVVLWDRDTPFEYWLRDSSEWKFGYSSEDWVVACRRGSDISSRCA